MSIAKSIIIGLVIALAAIYAAVLLRDENELRIEPVDVFVGAMLGGLVGVINYFIPSFTLGSGVAFFAPICYIVMMCLYIYLIVWCYRCCSWWRDIIPFVLMALLFYFTTLATATMTSTMIENKALATIVVMSPTAMLVITLGSFIATLLWIRYTGAREYGWKRDYSWAKKACFGTLAATAVLALGLLFIPVTKAQDRAMMVGTGEVQSTVEPDDGMEPELEDSWVHYYNIDLQSDQIKDNDFNFGPNPYAESYKASDYDAALRYRMSKDPALAAGDMAWLDAIVGTRFLGEFYESCKGDWAKTINATKDAFGTDQSLYYQTLNAFNEFLDSADAVTVDYQTSALDDQMYMNPYTVSGVPDVIVMKTTDHAGYYLTYTFIIKDNTFKVAYRIDCGFQPTNVQKVMNITPVPQPTPTPTSTPTPTPTPTPTGGNGDDPTPTPVPTPTPTPGPKKDPSKGTKVNVEPNDDPGPGPSTNTGVNSNTSSADKPTNSNHMSNDDYNKAVQDLKDTNATQKTGSDSSTPSTPAPTPTTNVDNNGDKGNGGAPINNPTPVAPKDTVTGDPESAGMIGAPD